jgi:hypothetical protein
MCVHLADAHGHGVDAALQLGLQFLDLGLLFGQRCGPRGHAPGAGLALTDLEAEAESRGQDSYQDGREGDHRKGMRQVEMPGTTLTAREENYVHRARSCSLCFKGLHLAGILAEYSL